ncbi:hypothetical protein ACNQUF_12720, partial [Corynebacterium diphtheriae]
MREDRIAIHEDLLAGPLRDDVVRCLQRRSGDRRERHLHSRVTDTMREDRIAIHEDLLAGPLRDDVVR